MKTGNIDIYSVVIPWTEDQVASLNAFQRADAFHPFTCGCGCRGNLIAAADGWHCPIGNCYAQDWAWNWMADWSWQRRN